MNYLCYFSIKSKFESTKIPQLRKCQFDNMVCTVWDFSIILAPHGFWCQFYFNIFVDNIYSIHLLVTH